MPDLGATLGGGVGHFDKLGNACVKFHLCGVKHDEPGVEYTGIIDTGFTGFVQLPMQYAFALGLPLHGTLTVTLADGSQFVCLAALAKVTIAGKQETGIVTLAPDATEILVGMDLLRRFNLGLFVLKGLVLLISEDFIAEQVKKAAALQAAPATSADSIAPAPPSEPPDSAPEE